MPMKDLFLTLEKGVRLIKFNRPQKKNAWSQDMYRAIAHILNTDANNDQVVVTILTGAGDYYSSGNDIKSALEEGTSTTEEPAPKKLISAFINYPKLLIAVVNGPAIGIAATTAALCDVVYASERAWFETPFIKLGLCAEACSSYLFPRILGTSKASEMLFLNHRLTAQEAHQLGFVSKLVPHENLGDFIKGLYQYGQLSPYSVKASKALIRAPYKDILCECNDREFKQVAECINTEEFSQAIVKFMSRKNKL